MHKHYNTSAVFITLSAVTMLVLFAVQARVIINQNHMPSFAISHMIAYGYASSSSAGPVCGNGTKTSLEGCDDSNTTAGDGCSATCTVETGYSCTGTTPSVCSTTCGDGIMAGSEGCDDDDTDAGDGCSATCTVETGYGCTGTAPSVCSTTCGDSIVAGSEQCDAGGESSTCNTDCTTASCGDSKTNATRGETCDAGGSNASNGACTTSCIKTFCGDGIVQTPNGNGQSEACESALDSTCGNTCTVSTGIGISNYVPPPSRSSSSTVRLAPPAGCGNGTVELSKGEECDDGRFNGLSPQCDRWCHTQYCGDGIVQYQNGEECEPERLDNGTYVEMKCGKACAIPSCDSFGFCGGGCHWKFMAACTSSSAAPVLTPAQSSASSSSSFQDIQTAIAEGIEGATGPLSGEVQTSSSSSIQSLLLPVATSQGSSASTISVIQCGDGVMQAAEECDDGLNNSNAKPSACRMDCKKAFCGDDVQDAGEECDRGTANNLLGNGCTPTCKVSICGNTTLEPGEECDEGRRNSASKPDSCSTLCLLPRCGDGIIDTAFGEVCDNGRNNSATAVDGCRMNCVPAYCGDGIKDAKEQCDTGPKGSSTCTAACIAIGTVAIMQDVTPEEMQVTQNQISSLLFQFLLLLIFAHKLQRTMRR